MERNMKKEKKELAALEALKKLELDGEEHGSATS